jgi:mannosyl-oligosaccharide alpha-1,2-mannosidase
MDTAIVMGLKDIVDRQLAWLAEQDFSKSLDPQIDIFDSTICLLAGLQSAYDLIKSGKVPYAHTYNPAHVKALLRNAQNLADLLTPVFDSPSGLPWFYLETTTHNASHQMGANTAVAGTLIYEWHRLSDLTGNPKYRDLADRAETHLLHPKPEPLYPDLVGSNLDMATGEFTTSDVSWKSGIDSFYEVCGAYVCLHAQVKLVPCLC